MMNKSLAMFPPLPSSTAPTRQASLYIEHSIATYHGPSVHAAITDHCASAYQRKYREGEQGGLRERKKHMDASLCPIFAAFLFFS